MGRHKKSALLIKEQEVSYVTSNIVKLSKLTHCYHCYPAKFTIK